MERASLGPGSRIGSYKLETILAEGGMAIVWRATHIATDRRCAVKILKEQLHDRPELRELFIREAKVGARIGASPHIVDVLDAGVDAATGAVFLAMELLEGEDLQRLLGREGALPRALVAQLLEQLGEALDQAHGAGVVHRDLKPSNLFLTRDRRQRPVLKLLDFGISRLIDQEGRRTATHVGTPLYAAPEQLGPTWRKIAAKQGIAMATEVSPATDIWALGLLTFDLLTGKPGQFWGVVSLDELPPKVVLEEIPLASTQAAERAALLPPGFDGWFARCVHRDARQRFARASEAIEALLLLLPGEARAPTEPAALVPSPPADVSTRLGVETFVPPGPSPTLAAPAPPLPPAISASSDPGGQDTSLAAVRTFAPAEDPPLEPPSAPHPPARGPRRAIAGLLAALAAGLAVGAYLLVNQDKEYVEPPFSLERVLGTTKELDLPTSSLPSAPTPDVAAWVVLSRSAMSLGGSSSPLLRFPGPVGGLGATGLPEVHKKNGVNDLFLQPLGAALAPAASATAKAGPRRLGLVADGSTPYRVLVEVLFTAGQSSFESASVAARPGATGRVDLSAPSSPGLAWLPVLFPRAGSRDGGSADAARRGANVTVLATRDGIAIKAMGANLTQGCSETGAGLAVPAKSGKQDLPGLTACLAKLKKEADVVASERSAALSATPETPLSEIVALMGAMQGTAETGPLFPDINWAVFR